MENMTLGQVATMLAFVVGLIGSIKYLKNELTAAFNKSIEPIKSSIDKVDEAACKNYLVRFMRDVELGNKVGTEEVKQAMETYEHYTNDLKKNSFIHTKWELLLPEILKLLKED